MRLNGIRVTAIKGDIVFDLLPNELRQIELEINLPSTLHNQLGNGQIIFTEEIVGINVSEPVSTTNENE